MTVSQPPMLEFPAMLHGSIGDIRRQVNASGRAWAREYLKTGCFTPHRRMLQVSSNEVLIMHSGADSSLVPRPRWRLYMLHSIFTSLNEGVPDEERQRMEEAFESFCLSTPWGALGHAVSPLSPRSAERMARRLGALLRFWEVLRRPRYAFWFDRPYTLEELIEDIYGLTLAAWCPEGPAPVHEHLARMVERMARATREDCMQAVLRVIPALVRANADLQHREELSDTDFLRERLAALSPEDWEDVSSAHRYALNGQLYAWDRQLGQH
ncbi:hypothetical protein [Melittangium boletus]|uniref:Uncharacterized protein n=1 Tax=Melittangium boletus DSM 14713 TaxID=1294270 RepID=A0A250IA49_9BACT|nr:hypothetical protein [Melittangium boletus]ATB28093.1 hypothetical protein MEBOL_001538 [Melittangium boletus DSM 14713]